MSLASTELPTKKLGLSDIEKPLCIDLFCGAGGASMGLYRAGFDVVGVDIKPQPRYPFRFIQADALTFPLNGFDFIWASPVCKRFSSMSIVRAGLSDSHPNQIPEIRRRLIESGLPYVVENVPRAPLIQPQVLCGQSFGLGVIRHRLFESNFGWLAPAACNGHRPGHLCIVGHGGPANQIRWKIAEARAAMGIDWMTRDELVESIPPAYAEFIGKQAMNFIGTKIV